MHVRCEQFVIMWIYDMKNVTMVFVNLPDTQLQFYVKVCIGYYNVNGRRNWQLGRIFTSCVPFLMSAKSVEFVAVS